MYESKFEGLYIGSLNRSEVDGCIDLGPLLFSSIFTSFGPLYCSGVTPDFDLALLCTTSVKATNENLPPKVIKELARELKSLDESPPEDIRVLVNEDNFSNIYADIEGPCKSLHDSSSS